MNRAYLTRLNRQLEAQTPPRRYCQPCGRTLALTEANFYRCAKGRNGFFTYCKQCDQRRTKHDRKQTKHDRMDATLSANGVHHK